MPNPSLTGCTSFPQPSSRIFFALFCTVKKNPTRRKSRKEKKDKKRENFLTANISPGARRAAQRACVRNPNAQRPRPYHFTKRKKWIVKDTRQRSKRTETDG